MLRISLGIGILRSQECRTACHSIDALHLLRYRRTPATCHLLSNLVLEHICTFSSRWDFNTDIETEPKREAGISNSSSNN